MLILYVVSIAIITVLVHLLIYALRNFERKKREQDNSINNIAKILNKLEDGGNTMDEDLKKLAKYLAGKIEDAKEDMLARIDELEEELINSSEPEDEEDEDLEDEFDELEDEEEEKPKKKIPNKIDISKRQAVTEPEPEKPKKEKRSLFGNKK